MRDYIIEQIELSEYSNGLMEMSLIDIFKNYNLIEEKIEYSLLMSIHTFLESKEGLSINGKNLLYESELFTLDSQFNQLDRILKIFIINPTKKYPLKTFNIKVNSIGQIAHLELILPEFFCKNIKVLFAFLKEQITYAYSSLEMALLNKIDSITKKLFYNIHDILIAKATSLNLQEEIRGTFWFDITNIENRKCRNFLTREMLKIVIEKLKQTKIIGISPMVLIADFITSDITELLTREALKQNKDYISIPYSEKYKVNHVNVLTLESIIFKRSATYCQTHIIHGINNDYLQIAYPKTLESTFIKIIDNSLKKSLSIQYEKNYSSLHKMMQASEKLKSDFSSKEYDINLYKFLKEIFYEITIKDPLKEIFKELF